MSTRAIVIDERVEGKGFYVHHDGYPAGLGSELKTVFKVGMQIEEVFKQWVQFKKQQHVNFLIKKEGKTDTDLVNELNKYIINVNGSFFLPPEHVSSVAKAWVLDEARKAIETNLEYIYIIKNDGVYVIGDSVPELRKVKNNEIDPVTNSWK
ncbi:hypothetical protein G9F72_019305 [Clostridium estertheticum]|uniref:hypothetical protein n=1 Tax=Clostridium estertheticum TaxID=238834 RepID=UPI0013E93021|nr:hypothetical protein [Clostridium estertheticum]MBZ9688481.1 hypothetical protein [Clostridium estertheticum]